ncbi:MAG: hypothetical protein HQ538_04955, partial [Parcubacteria group bacterium]|nr:hypothetical protein [Parcubacteria group bacterium]
MSIKLLFTSSKIKNVERKFRGFDSVSWLFLAKDYKLLKKLDQGLSSKYRRVDISKIQNDVANDIRAKYVAWIDKLNELNGEDLGWWFNAISSRNTSETDLFQYACYLEVLKVLFTDRKSMPQLIIVESVGLAKAIEHWAKDIKIKIDIDGYRLAHMRRLKQYVYFFLKWLRYIGVVGARCYFAYITKKRNRREYNQIKQNIIVSTYVHDQDISEKGCFKDRYFPFLHEFLDEKGFSVMVHPVLHGFNFKFLSVFKRLRSSKTQFIIPEDNLRLYDYFLAFKNSLKSFINKIKLLPFNGLAMDSIVREETMVKFSASA